MITFVFLVVAINAIVYFLIGYLKSRFIWVERECKNGMRVCFLIIFNVAGFLFGGQLVQNLVQNLGRLIPTESYEEAEKTALSSFIGVEDVYAVIEKDDLVFLKKGKLVRRKYDEISEDVSFLPEDRNVPPYLVELKAKRSGFWKYFFIDPDKLKFFVPRSGIKKGEIKFVEGYEFISEK